MGLHNGFQRDFFTLNGNVMTSGGSIDLAKGQFGIFKTKEPTVNGMVAVSDFSSAGQNDKFQIKVGNNGIRVTRGLSNDNRESRPFKLSEVKDLKVFVPEGDKRVDKFMVGYDGINQETALDFTDLKVGETELLSVKLSEGVIGILGYDKECAMVNLHFEKEFEGQTNQEIVEKAVKRLQRAQLKESIRIDEVLNVSAINSENPSSVPNAVSHTFYNLEVSDQGSSNDLAEVEAQFGTDVKRTSYENGVSTYTLLLPTIAASGTPADFNAPDGSTISWTIGEEGSATTQEYTIQLTNNADGSNRLSELQGAYPELTIAVAQDGGNDVEGGCQTVYTTTVTSNVVFEECDPIIREMFETEPPQDYEFIPWSVATETYDENALMGIYLEGMEVLNVPGEEIRDSVPFENTSTRISVAGGFRSSVFESFTEGTGDRFDVKLLQRAEDLENLGGNLWELEDENFNYFNGYSRHRNQDGHQNEFIKQLLGEESVLKPNAQYVVYILNVQPKNHSQGFAQQLEESFNYTVFVEKGKQSGVEALLNDLASNAGLDTVSTS